MCAAILVANVCSLGAEAKIAILCDSFPRAHCQADPARLVRILNDSGCPAEAITADRLGDPDFFNTRNYWLAVLPYGGYFPAQARENFLAYLRAGGDFLSVGGYTFDKLVIWYEGNWIGRDDLERLGFCDVDIGGDDTAFLTGAWHKPEIRDGISRRWIGDEAGVRLPVVPNAEYTLEIRLYADPTTPNAAKQILLNGRGGCDISSTGDQTIQLSITRNQIGDSRTLDVGFVAVRDKPLDPFAPSDRPTLGIAVDRVRLWPEGRERDLELLAPLSVPMNTHRGVAHDFLELKPEQIGVFDAGYRLLGGRTIVPARDQRMVPNGYHLKGGFEGWAATGVTGTSPPSADRGRLIPLIETRDEYGRFVGNAGAMMVNYAEPFRGSLWAFFGVENADLSSGEKGKALLLSVVKAMRQGLFLHEVRPSEPCYEDGAPVTLTCKCSNFSILRRVASAQFEIASKAGATLFSEHCGVDLAPGETKGVATTWQCNRFDDDYYDVKVSLVDDAGRIKDVSRTAFYVWKPQTSCGGISLSYASNYLRDAESPRFFFGAQTFYPYPTLDVLELERDASMMADNGLRIARSFAWNLGRGLDALVMASRRHELIAYPSGVGWLTVDADKMREYVAYAQSVAQRYRAAPGLMFDIKNEPLFTREADPVRDKLFNEYLTRKYESENALRAAWGGEFKGGETFGSIAMGWMTEDWSSVRSRDIYRFLLERYAAWAGALAGAIKSADSQRLVSIGFLGYWASEMTADPCIMSGPLDFLDRHWYGPLKRVCDYDAQLVAVDRRYCGKAPASGEFGSKTHPAFGESQADVMLNYDTMEEQELRYLHIGHYCLGLGGAFASNWHFRDPAACIFPYGIVHSDWAPKPTLKVYRAMSLLFSTLKPRYVPPAVYLVLPDEARFGGRSGRIIIAAQRAANGLIDARLTRGTINEWDLSRLPKEARMLVMPLPLALSDDGYARLRTFVEDGGVLYLSGDFSYDVNRRRTHPERLEELAGVRFLRERYRNVCWEEGTSEQVTYDAGIEAPPPVYTGYPTIEFEPLPETEVLARAGKRPVAVRKPLGKGCTFFSADPAELSDHPPQAAIYRLVARYAKVAPEQAMPDRADLHIFRVPLENGGEAVIAGNMTTDTIPVEVSVDGHAYVLEVGACRQGMIVSEGGRLLGLEAQGAVSRDGRGLVAGNGHFFMVSLDNTDIAESNEVAIVSLHRAEYTLPQRDYRLEAGEVQGGTWRSLAKLSLRRGQLRVPQSLAGDIILLTRRDGTGHAGQRVVEILAR
jgi:hypothetical protein